MLNKFAVLLFCVGVFISGTIYANEDTKALSANERISDSSLCLAAAKEASADYGVSFDLLQTVAAVESGVWNEFHNAYVAWPWTVNAKGRGYYFKTKEEAVAAAKKFIASGVKSIDVGCMQINMKFHGEAFSSIEEAMDPVNNVRYSAKFLRKLYSRNGNDWKQAAKSYHSGNSTEGALYAGRLEKRFEAYKIAGLSDSTELF